MSEMDAARKLLHELQQELCRGESELERRNQNQKKMIEELQAEVEQQGREMQEQLKERERRNEDRRKQIEELQVRVNAKGLLDDYEARVESYRLDREMLLSRAKKAESDAAWWQKKHEEDCKSLKEIHEHQKNDLQAMFERQKQERDQLHCQEMANLNLDYTNLMKSSDTYETELNALRHEVHAVLNDLGPAAVRVREGGAEENIRASLAVTVSKLKRDAEQARKIAELASRYGWNGVENSKILSEYILDIFGQLDNLKQYRNEYQLLSRQLYTLIGEVKDLAEKP